MRLDKRVAEQFGLSRRRAQEAVWRGQVDVAGQTCLEPGREIDPETPALLSSQPPASGNRRAAIAGFVRRRAYFDRRISPPAC